MLLNPFKDKDQLVTLGDSRILEKTFDVIGTQIRDSSDLGRVWTVQGTYAPVTSRFLGGIRVSLTDNKDFVTFLNQRDLEVLLEVARPGDYCPWTEEDYLSPDDREWCGLRADHDDLLDDLYERELLLRTQYQAVLPTGLEITRRIHVEDRIDAEELLVLLGDFDRDTGFYPDTRFETVGRRWARVERRKVTWQRIT